MTQSELGREIGIGQTGIANYENGKRFPDEKNLVKIADFFEVSIDSLIGRKVNITGNNRPGHDGFSYTPSNLGKMADSYMKESQKPGKGGIEVIMNLLDAGYDEEQIMLDLLEASLKKAGLLWAEGLYNEAMEHQLSMTVIQSLLLMRTYFKSPPGVRGKAAALSVSGENHNIGLRMISRFLEIDGWETYFLGSSVPASSLQDFIKSNKINLILISVTLNENADSACSIIGAVKACQPPPSVIAGGAGIKYNYDRIKKAGADLLCSNAAEMISFARNLKNQQSP